eukprot:TRINITY_DN8383_c0_g2_i1.p1 TRINITY_DN8383_c0_g2~~TRINITY_DN8383_c0_g2_i1.p1  ORF type:complete len:387 (+),score=91.66 TRINITY_DN8383_c0_g2_i1:148-1308(+)
MMTTLGRGNTPTLLESAGIKPSQIGINGKESGYTITRERCRLILMLVMVFVGALCCGIVGQMFELRIERRGGLETLKHAATRTKRAAARLAKVEMDLWGHFKDDNDEVGAVREFLETMNESYTSLHEELSLELASAANASNLSPTKARLFSATIIEEVVNHRNRTTEEIHSLLDKIIAAGKKSAALRTHVEQDLVNEMLQHVAEEADDELDDYGEDHVNDEENEDLEVSVTEFFDIYDAFSNSFPGPYPELATGTPTMRSLQNLLDAIDLGLSPEEAEARLEKLHLETMKLDFKKNTNLYTKDVREYVEMLVFFDRIPRSEIRKWMVLWHNSKEKHAFEMWTKLIQLKKKKELPNHWFVRIAAVMQKHDVGESDLEPTDDHEQDDE